jgi:hypothetical protein
MHTPATERDDKGAVMYTTIMMPTGLATLTWWNTEVGWGCQYHKQSVGLCVFQGNLKSGHRAYTIDHYFTQHSSKAITLSKIKLLRYKREPKRQGQEINNA